MKIMQTFLTLKSWFFFIPWLQLKNTEFAIKNKLKYLLNEIRGFKFVMTLVKKTKKKDEKKYGTFCSISKAETIIHNTVIDSIFESFYKIIVIRIWKCQTEGSSWTTDSVIEENINVSKYKALSNIS